MLMVRISWHLEPVAVWDVTGERRVASHHHTRVHHRGEELWVSSILNIFWLSTFHQWPISFIAVQFEIKYKVSFTYILFHFHLGYSGSRQWKLHNTPCSNLDNFEYYNMLHFILIIDIDQPLFLTYFYIVSLVFLFFHHQNWLCMM